jgi:pimeloyl-ACP methyl ester carboxylesterase
LIATVGGSSAAVVGHDWGGWAGQWAAMLHPERVERLAILNVPHPVVLANVRLRPYYQLLPDDRAVGRVGVSGGAGRLIFRVAK